MADSALVTKESGAGGARQSRSLASLKKGIRTADDFILTMTALMADLLDGSVDPATAQAVCLVGKNILKAAELQQIHGEITDDGRKIALVGGIIPALSSGDVGACSIKACPYPAFKDGKCRQHSRSE
jgi:hypothetical protein